MNFLAHLWLADRAGATAAGAVLGDVLHGAVPDDLPPALAVSVRLHRRIDAETDRHPGVLAARRQFGPHTRRHSGILLDLLYDHALALDWRRYSTLTLPVFAARAARAVADDWVVIEGHAAPDPARFAELLVSYGTIPGFERAVQRTAHRMRRPEGLLNAMQDWQAHLPLARKTLPKVLHDLERMAGEFVAAAQAPLAPDPDATQAAAPKASG